MKASIDLHNLKCTEKSEMERKSMTPCLYPDPYPLEVTSSLHEIHKIALQLVRDLKQLNMQ